MKFTLTITASASALARILQIVESDDDAVAAPVAPVTAAGVFPTPEMPAMPVFPTNPVMPEVAAVVPTVAAPTGAPEFDSTGLAWDARIHSKQKGQTNDGKWRKQRGVDDAYYNAVEAELRAIHGGAVAPQPVAVAPQPVAVAPVAVAPVAVAPEVGNVQPAMIMPPVAPVATVYGADVAAPVTSEPVPVAIPMPVAPVAVAQPVPVATPVAVPVAAPVNEPVTFHTVMTHVGTAMGAGTMTPDYLVALVAEINQQCGTTMQSFTDMAAFPNAVEYCWGAFARDGKL